MNVPRSFRFAKRETIAYYVFLCPFEHLPSNRRFSVIRELSFPLLGLAWRTLRRFQQIRISRVYYIYAHETV